VSDPRPSHAVANAGREGVEGLAAFGVGHQNVGAIGFGIPRRAPSMFRFPKTYVLGLFLLMSSATFDPEPTEMNMRLPSLEKATSRVLCPPCFPSARHDDLGGAARLEIAVVIGKRTTELLFAT
jgi:hypothetical protein